MDSSDKDAVVAVSHFTFDAVQTGSDPNQNPLCGKKIRARRVNEETGKSVSIDVTVIDRCEYSDLSYSDERCDGKRLVANSFPAMLTNHRHRMPTD